MLEQKTKEYNWYYTQVFSRNKDRSHYGIYFVTFAENPTAAKILATEYVRKNAPDGYSVVDQKDINLYQKNYIRESRVMVESGKYCGVKPAGV